MAHEYFCHPAISQLLMADMSFNIACEELQVTQITQLHFLTFEFCSYFRPRLL